MCAPVYNNNSYEFDLCVWVFVLGCIGCVSEVGELQKRIWVVSFSVIPWTATKAKNWGDRKLGEKRIWWTQFFCNQSSIGISVSQYFFFIKFDIIVCLHKPIPSQMVDEFENRYGFSAVNQCTQSIFCTGYCCCCCYRCCSSWHGSCCCCRSHASRGILCIPDNMIMEWMRLNALSLPCRWVYLASAMYAEPSPINILYTVGQFLWTANPFSALPM